jgi:hypothetical protein
MPHIEFYSTGAGVEGRASLLVQRRGCVDQTSYCITGPGNSGEVPQRAATAIPAMGLAQNEGFGRERRDVAATSQVSSSKSQCCQSRTRE